MQTYDLQALSELAEIRQLNARKNRLADVGQSDVYVSNFTKDAEFDIVGSRVYRDSEQVAAATQVIVHVIMRSNW